jgi:hypothetical protein
LILQFFKEKCVGGTSCTIDLTNTDFLNEISLPENVEDGDDDCNDLTA